MTAAASRQVLAMTLASLVAAVIALLVFVLPAEFDLDPTGLGARLGIKGMAGYQVSALSPSERALRSDQVEFPLGPFESVEYKYRLEAGEALVYSWDAGSAVVYDMHSDPDDGEPGWAATTRLQRTKLWVLQRAVRRLIRVRSLPLFPVFTDGSGRIVPPRRWWCACAALVFTALPASSVPTASIRGTWQPRSPGVVDQTAVSSVMAWFS